MREKDNGNQDQGFGSGQGIRMSELFRGLPVSSFISISAPSSATQEVTVIKSAMNEGIRHLRRAEFPFSTYSSMTRVL